MKRDYCKSVHLKFNIECLEASELRWRSLDERQKPFIFYRMEMGGRRGEILCISNL